MFLKSTEFVDGGLSLLLAQKGKCCVSVILSAGPRQKKPKTGLGGILELMRGKLLSDMDCNAVEEASFNNCMRALDQQLSWNGNEEGIGIYWAPDFCLLVRYYFPVQSKVFAGKRFLLRDFLYQLGYSFPYFVLRLNELQALLYKGRLKTLEMVSDEYFPLKAGGEEPALSATGYRAFQDSSHSFLSEPQTLPAIGPIQQMRAQRRFFKQLDLHLNLHIFDHIPLVVCGPCDLIADFKRLSRFAANNCVFLTGAFENEIPQSLTEMTWPLVHSCMVENQKFFLEEFKAWAKKEGVHSGLSAVWRSVARDNGGRLLLEKNYAPSAFETSAGKLGKPDGANGPCRFIADAAEDLMEAVLQGHGEVMLVPDGTLGLAEPVAYRE